MPAPPKNKPFSTRLPDEVRQALRDKAQALGLTESDLGRMYIIEKLRESAAPLAPLLAESRTLAALIIAALSDSIELEQAHELITQHLNLNSEVTP